MVDPLSKLQAIGQAHRMGQEYGRGVYRLIARGPLKKNPELQDQKKHLVSQVFRWYRSRAGLSLAEIREILGDFWNEKSRQYAL